MRPPPKAAAYHEAGHAVAAILCGEHITRVQAVHGAANLIDSRGRVQRAGGLCETTLNPLPTWLASMTLEANPTLRPIMEVRARNNVFQAGAGAAAEARATHRSLGGLWLSSYVAGDFAEGMLSLEPYVPDAAAREREVWATWNRTSGLVSSGRPWLAVCAIAEAVRSGETDGSALEDVGRAILPDAPNDPLEMAL